MINFVFLLLILSSGSAHADWDFTSSLSQFVYNNIFRNCQPSKACCTKAKTSIAEAKTTKFALQNYSGRSGFFREVAKEQIAETACEINYLSHFDHRGLDCNRAVKRRKAQGFARDINIIKENYEDPVMKNPSVENTQSLIVHDLALRIPKIRELKKGWSEAERSRVNWCIRPKGETGPDGGRRCKEFEKQAETLDRQIQGLYSSIWNINNSAMRRYVDRLVKQKSFNQDVFVEQALNVELSGSLQRAVIEPAVEEACHDEKMFKEAESNPDILEQESDEDDSGRKRNYKKLLTAAGVARIKRDPEFEKKYGHLQCQLSVQYGKKSEVIDYGLQGAVFIASLAQPYLAAAGSSTLFAGMGARAVTLAGSALIAGIQGASAVVNVKNLCFGGSNPTTLREQVCKSANEPLNPHTQLRLLYQDINSGNCALGILFEGVAVKQLATSFPALMKSFKLAGGKFIPLNAAQASQICPTCNRININAGNRHYLEHFTEPGSNAIDDLSYAAKKARPDRSTTLFPSNVQFDDVAESLKKPRLLKPSTEPSRPEVSLFEATIDLKEGSYEVRLAICKAPACHAGGEIFEQGELISVFPKCGPGVIALYQLNKGELKRKPKPRPCSP